MEVLSSFLALVLRHKTRSSASSASSNAARNGGFAKDRGSIASAKRAQQGG